MPIEIKELLVEINVASENQKGDGNQQGGQDSVKDYIEQVLTIIDNRKER